MDPKTLHAFRWIYSPLLAFVITITMAAISWLLSGQPNLTGIDDAAITRSYSENIAGGFGFVYNIGGERVEGATSFLWTLLVAFAYLFSGTEEYLIIGMTVALTTVAVWGTLQITAVLATQLGFSPRLATGLAAFGLIGTPSYFIWSVWTMMEIPLWSATLILFIWRLVTLVEAEDAHNRFDITLIIAAAVLPLIRPEGIAFSIGLLGLALFLRPSRFSALATAAASAFLSCGVLVLFRIWYFGYPLPNTYYAKVSSDRLQGLIDGLKYLSSFVNGYPFAEIILAAWVVLVFWAAYHLFFRKTAVVRTVLLIGAAIFGILFTYAALGGDHFALWRFYQPIMPLFVLGPVITILLVTKQISPVPSTQMAVIALVSVSVWIGINSIAIYQSRFGILKEFKISELGEEFGRFLSQFDPKPKLAVTAAGGIALTYDGEILDMLGLNWAKMAHANPVKVGHRNHASFDKGVFWETPPDMYVYYTWKCQTKYWVIPNATGGSLRGLITEPEFQSQFSPIILQQDDGRCWNGYVRNDWLDENPDQRIQLLKWSELTLL